jgi:hypothetical protein
MCGIYGKFTEQRKEGFKKYGCGPVVLFIAFLPMFGLFLFLAQH